MTDIVLSASPRDIFEQITVVRRCQCCYSVVLDVSQIVLMRLRAVWRTSKLSLAIIKYKSKIKIINVKKIKILNINRY